MYQKLSNLVLQQGRRQKTWFYGVVVSTLDFESSDLGSTPGEVTSCTLPSSVMSTQVACLLVLTILGVNQIPIDDVNDLFEMDY
ncbi:hypothetical protein CR513_30646, partial [Mucuna pruriens]